MQQITYKMEVLLEVRAFHYATNREICSLVARKRSERDELYPACLRQHLWILENESHIQYPEALSEQGCWNFGNLFKNMPSNAMHLVLDLERKHVYS